MSSLTQTHPFVNRLLTKFVASGLAMAAAFSAEAQGSRRDSAAVLPTVTVTGTRGEASILTTPLAITKITAPTLRAQNGFGLDEALSKVPGVLAQSRYGTSDVRIVIRGFGARGAGDRSNAGTSRGVRFLVDGIPETEPDGRTSFDQIDLGTASAVEVIRSNASAVWGNAAGGVVNVLTPIWTDKPAFELQPVMGSFGLQRYVFRSSMPVGTGGTAWANVTNTQFDGYRLHSNARRGLFNAGVLANVGEKTKVGFYASGADNLFRLPGALTQSQLDRYFAASGDNRATDTSGANPQYVSRDERRYNRIARLGATMDHEISDDVSISTMLFISPKYLQRSERNTFRDFVRYHLGGNVVARANIGGTKLTAGIDEAYQDGAIQFYNLVNGQRGPTLADNKAEGANNLGIFAQDELNIGEKLSLILGARYDNVSYYNKSFINPALNGDKTFDKVSPKLGASWKLGATRSIYANFGGGIEVPAGNEVDPFAAQGEVAVNPLLEPIQSTTLEAGFKTVSEKLGPLTLMGDLAVYNTNVKNDLQPYNEGRFYMSAGKTRRTGVELGLNAETKSGVFATIALTASSNKYLEYSVDSTLFKANGGTAVFDDNKVVGVPDVMGEIEIGMEVPGLRSVRVKAGLEHIGTYFADDANLIEVPSYSIINFTAELRKPIITRGGWGVRGFLTVHNLTDKQYVGSAFLNPLFTSTNPATREAIAFEPGMPRAISLSFSVGRLQQ